MVTVRRVPPGRSSNTLHMPLPTPARYEGIKCTFNFKEHYINKERCGAFKSLSGRSEAILSGNNLIGGIKARAPRPPVPQAQLALPGAPRAETPTASGSLRKRFVN